MGKTNAERATYVATAAQARKSSSSPVSSKKETPPLESSSPTGQQSANKEELYPKFARPTKDECKEACNVLERLHGDQVRKNFSDPDAPSQDYPYAMDALVVAALSQATSWNNAKRAMKNMKTVYGSTFAYQAIVDGGVSKLELALRPGGMQNRKAKLLMKLLEDVREKYGKWDLQHLFEATDEEVTEEVTKFWGIGPKCAHCLLSICLKRDVLAVDTHVYRLSGLWGWRPKDADREQAQQHLDCRIPNDLKYPLHYQMIVHGRECPRCRGNGNPKADCDFHRLINGKNL